MLLVVLPGLSLMSCAAGPWDQLTTWLWLSTTTLCFCLVGCQTVYLLLWLGLAAFRLWQVCIYSCPLRLVFTCCAASACALILC